MQELTAVCEKWQFIGKELGVRQSSLDFISNTYSDPGECLSRMFSYWLHECRTTTWWDIIAVLRSSRIDESQLSEHLEAKYGASELIYKSKLHLNAFPGYMTCGVQLITGSVVVCMSTVNVLMA